MQGRLGAPIAVESMLAQIIAIHYIAIYVSIR
jgi:hypothetical protein